MPLPNSITPNVTTGHATHHEELHTQVNAGGLINVNEPPPVVHASLTGDDADADGRWDRPYETISTALIAAAGGKLLIAPGVYQQSISVNTEASLSGTIVDGSGGTWGSTTTGTIIKPESAVNAISILGSAGVKHNNMVFRDLLVDGRDSGGTPVTTNNIFIGYSERTKFFNVTSIYSGGHGWHSDSAGGRNGCEWYACTALHNVGTGLHQGAGLLDNNAKIFGGIFGNNEQHGIFVRGTNTSIYGAWIKENFQWGIKCAVNGCVIDECLIEDNARSYGTWAATTAYLVGDRRRATNTTTNPDTFMCTVAGTSSGTEPTWNATAPNMGTTLTDGTVTWLNVGRGANANRGAQIEDTGADKLLVRSQDSLHGGPLGMGTTIWQYPQSTAAGITTGAMTMEFSGGAGMNAGFVFGSTSSVAFMEPSGRSSDIYMRIRGKGARGVRLGSETCEFFNGTGSPEGVTAASPGSVFQSTNGNVYRKSTGTGNTGWVAM